MALLVIAAILYVLDILDYTVAGTPGKYPPGSPRSVGGLSQGPAGSTEVVKEELILHLV